MRLECRYTGKTLWPKTEEDAARTDFVIVSYIAKDRNGVWKEFVAKGEALPRDKNLLITINGNFETDSNRRTAFKVESYTTAVVKTIESVTGYLSSGIIKGVGPEIAGRIVGHFGVDAVDILENDPERLLEVNGIGPAVLEEIKESFYQNREIHGLMEYLGQFKISVNKAARIVDHFGARSLEIVRSDLYHLCAVSGFGYLTVDAIAVKMGHDMKTYPRVLAGAEFLLDENRERGHLFMHPEDFLKSLLKILNKNKKKTDRLSMEELAEFVRVIFDQATSITLDNRCVYLTHDLENEKRFARLMAERLVAEHIRAEKGKKDPYVRVAGNDLRLSAEQEAAVAAAFQHDTVIITGGPGTGKTTVLDTFIKWYRKRFPAKSRMLLVAPTGRASRRMAEATGREAYTIHRAFQLGSEGDSFKEDKRAADVIIVDEFSMSDMWVSAAMLSMISRDTKLIFVGDPMQLPSVGPGSVLNEIIACGIIPTIHLKTVFRQAAGSSIAENAQRIEYASRKILARDQDGNFKYEFLKYDDDTIFLSADDQDEASESVCQLYERAAKALGAEKVQILAPLKSKGACSVNKLNAAIQFILREDPQMGFKAGKDRYFCEGDPVIQLKNVNGVCNGDMGIVSGLSSDGVAVQYAGVDGPRVYKGDNLRIIMLAFALTIHKSQGSEYPLVIIPVLDAHAFMLNKNLIYTALTRGKRRVVFVGSEYALRMAALKKDANMRNTNLAKRIVAIYKKLLEECICQQEDAAASA